MVHPMAKIILVNQNESKDGEIEPQLASLFERY